MFLFKPLCLLSATQVHRTVESPLGSQVTFQWPSTQREVTLFQQTSAANVASARVSTTNPLPEHLSAFIWLKACADNHNNWEFTCATAIQHFTVFLPVIWLCHPFYLSVDSVPWQGQVDGAVPSVAEHSQSFSVRTLESYIFRHWPLLLVTRCFSNQCGE